MKNWEMSETGKTARLPPGETYVLDLLKKEEKDILQVTAYR